MLKRVMIVDDSDANLYLLKSLLEEEGLEVTAARNGQEALDSAQADSPDLIVSDILMPVMDGYMLCRKCKEDERLRQIPFVFYTATYTEPKDEKFALSLGADRFVLKPQEPETLIQILKEVWEERSAAGPVAQKPLGEEMEFFRQYNQVLFTKLEKKILDLETANRKLKCLEEQYRLSFENVTDIVWTIDADLNVRKMSPSVERMLGYKAQDFIGRSVSDLVKILTPESMERAMAEISLVLNGQTIPTSVYSLVARDGTVKHGEISGAPIYRNRDIVGMVSVVRDITDHKRMEETLEREHNLLRNLIDNVPDRIYAKDAEGRFIICNEAMIRRMGKTSMTELEGKSDFDLLPREMAQRFYADEQAIIESGIPMINREEPLTTEGGTITRWNLATKVPLLDKQGNRVGIVGVGREITELKQAEQKLKDTLDSLKKAVNTTIQVMVSAVETRDPYTAGHQLRVADLACAIAGEMGLAQEKREGIRMAGSIHDIGKLSIPAEILVKPTKLSAIEFSLIKEHSRKGYEMLQDVESSWPLAEIVYQHHERMDGSGYPRNLKGDDILMEARIMAVSDVVESMASHRPYRPTLGMGAALEEILKNRGILYDPLVVDTCLKLFHEKGYNLHWSEPFLPSAVQKK
jgi:PAS domain S-box-containing protein/putative nucleotidyltransferase with HDIG domain